MAASLQKAFNKLHGEHARAEAAAESAAKPVAPKSEEDILRERTTAMTLADCIPRILLAWSDKDYFRLLGLPAVDVDALGRPTWECTDIEVSRAYRKLSLFVHPDKHGNRGNEKAREAFERLNEAHRILRDPAQRADELSKRLEEAKLRRAKAEANASLEERLALNAEKGNTAAQLRKQEEELLANKLFEQSRRRQEESQKKRDRKNKAAKRRKYSSEDEEVPPAKEPAKTKDKDGESSDDDDVSKRLARLSNSKRRRK